MTITLLSPPRPTLKPISTAQAADQRPLMRFAIPEDYFPPGQGVPYPGPLPRTGPGLGPSAGRPGRWRLAGAPCCAPRNRECPPTGPPSAAAAFLPALGRGRLVERDETIPGRDRALPRPPILRKESSSARTGERNTYYLSSLAHRARAAMRAITDLRLFDSFLARAFPPMLAKRRAACFSSMLLDGL